MKFLSSARDRGLAVTGTKLKDLAERQTQKAGIVGFKVSDGWLGKVKARHGISRKKLSGKAGSVNILTVKNWNEELPGILTNYKMENVYNCDEIFWKQPTMKSLVLHGDEKKTNLGFHL